jgi:hypothetical protein
VLTPAQNYSCLRRLFDHVTVQGGPADAEAHARGKIRLNGNSGTRESDPAKGVGLGRINRDSKFSECGKAAGHQTFATGFVDWRQRAIYYNHLQIFLTRGQRGCKTRGPSTDDNDIGFCLRQNHITIARAQVQNRSPGPWLPTAPRFRQPDGASSGILREPQVRKRTKGFPYGGGSPMKSPVRPQED